MRHRPTGPAALTAIALGSAPPARMSGSATDASPRAKGTAHAHRTTAAAGRAVRRRVRRAPRTLAALALPLGLLALCPSARAEFKLRYPIVDYREFEFEHNGDTTFDKRGSGKSNDQSYTNEIELGVTPFWTLGLEGERAAEPGENLRYEATTVENIFQLTPQGKYWADLGFFAEYSHAASRADADSVTFGPLVQKELSDVLGVDSLHTLNLLVSKEIGRNRSDATPLFFAWQSRIRLHPLFEPGIELFSGIDDIESPGKLADQQHRAGPMFAGVYNLAPFGKLRYEAGYLFGLTRATEKGTARWRLEYEIPF
jgi:hypothetical protein